MVKPHTFEEKDKEKLVELLNLTHLKINNLDGKEAFEYFRLMQWAQQSLLPKVNAHILEIKAVHEPAEPAKSEKKVAKKAK